VLGGRFWLGVGLLALLLAVSLLTTWGMQAIHKPAEQEMEAAAAAALAGDFPGAVAAADRAYSRWQTYRNCTAAFADHGPMDDVDSLFAEMQIYAQAEEIPHFAACCNQLQALLKAMYDAHVLTWWNFL